MLGCVFQGTVCSTSFTSLFSRQYLTWNLACEVFFYLREGSKKWETLRYFFIKLVAITLDLVIGSQDFVWVAAAVRSYLIC